MSEGTGKCLKTKRRTFSLIFVVCFCFLKNKDETVKRLKPFSAGLKYVSLEKR